METQVAASDTEVLEATRQYLRERIAETREHITSARQMGFHVSFRDTLDRVLRELLAVAEVAGMGGGQ